MLKAQAAGSTRKRVMLHSVSVGEINALRAMVPMLVEHCDVIVSTTTDTGLARAQSLYGEIEGCEVVRYPLDCSWMVKRFLDTVQPDVVGLVELEVWPNFIKECTKRRIPIGIINGRLSARSFKGYRKFRFLLKPTFERLSFACVQDQAYFERIHEMGVAKDRLSITGSMKWDSVHVSGVESGVESGADSGGARPSNQAIEIAEAMGVDLDRPIIVAGSTGPGEEELLDQACPSDVQLIMAPRKTDRFDEAADAVPGCIRRSADGRAECGSGNTRFLLDTIGELSAMYEIADVVIIGRSFFDLYGSDPIEPAAMGKPVLIGPAHSDFAEAMSLLLDADAIQVVEKQGVGDAVERLLVDTELCKQIGKRAQECVIRQQGASRQHIETLLGVLGYSDAEMG